MRRRLQIIITKAENGYVINANSDEQGENAALVATDPTVAADLATAAIKKALKITEPQPPNQP